MPRSKKTTPKTTTASDPLNRIVSITETAKGFVVTKEATNFESKPMAEKKALDLFNQLCNSSQEHE